MTDIALIKKLRDVTGHSITKCKEALEEAGGDMDKAQDLLRERGALAAEKKADRDLGSGVVQSYIHTTNQVGAMLELLCETDFVARNETFIKLAQDLAMHCTAFQPQYVSRERVPEEVLATMREELQSDVDADKPKEVQEKIIEGKIDTKLQEAVLLEQSFILDDSRSVKNVVDEMVQKFGERIEVGRFDVWSV
ncbi:MAG: elongation factor Ts [Candidatus Kaiserbacteria bacterium]|nr:elongation factor Ts [Candidatus Kaiserbacteria bacterium]